MRRASLITDASLIVEKSPAHPYSSLGIHAGRRRSRSLPFSRYQTSLNDAQAEQDPDGGYRFVVLIRDPGVANLADCTGHNDGEIIFRNYCVMDDIVPTVSKVGLMRSWPTCRPAPRR